MDLAKQLVDPLHLTLIWTQGTWRKIIRKFFHKFCWYCLVNQLVCFELQNLSQPPFIICFRSGAGTDSKTCVKTTEFSTYIEDLCIATSSP
jgi:hypothetical protein